jgi:hypothetical protein
MRSLQLETTQELWPLATAFGFVAQFGQFFASDP